MTIHVEGKIEIKPILKVPDNRTLGDIVGGYLEILNWTEFDGRPCAAFCNEEGKIDGLPVNVMATALWHEFLKRAGYATDDVLVGNIALVTGDKELMEAL
jgi:hypothetical protein